MKELYFPFLIIFGTLIIIILFNWLYCKYFTDKTESYLLATITTVISMTIGLFCILLIPIDIFLISYKEETFSNILIDRNNLQMIFFSSYSILLFFSFFLIPFSYFYGNSEVEEFNCQNEVFDRSCKAFKKSLIFICFCILLIISGLYFKHETNLEKGKEKKWITVLFDTEHSYYILILEGEQSISFIISILSLFGMLCLIVYTGHGLCSLPLFLIKGKKSLGAALQEYESDKSEIQQRMESLKERMRKRGNLNQKEKVEMIKLKENEKNIDSKLTKINNLIESDSIVDKLLNLLTPFRVIIGIIFLCFSIIILVSLFITSLDKALNSKCGLKCGYVLESKTYTNYLDSILLFLSKYYHLDFIVFASINIYVYICTVYGFIKIGVKFFCFEIFEIRKKSTLPQALLIGSFLISIMILAFMIEILTLAPQYSSFGTQLQISKNPKSRDVLQCNLSSVSTYSKNECVMSNISLFFNRISFSLPFFSTIFYFCNCIFIVVILISLIYSSFFKEEDPLEDFEENDIEEKVSLNIENSYL